MFEYNSFQGAAFTMKKRKILILIILSILLLAIYKLYDMGRYNIKNKEDLIECIINDEHELFSIIELMYNYNGKDIETIDSTNENGNGYRKFKNTILNSIFYKYKLSYIYRDRKMDLVWFSLNRHKKMTSYWGFYYTKEDMPRGYFEDTDNFITDGKGYRTQNKVNQYYTEKIMPHWYYFEIYWFHGLDL